MQSRLQKPASCADPLPSSFLLEQTQAQLHACEVRRRQPLPPSSFLTRQFLKPQKHILANTTKRHLCSALLVFQQSFQEKQNTAFQRLVLFPWLSAQAENPLRDSERRCASGCQSILHQPSNTCELPWQRGSDGRPSGSFTMQQDEEHGAIILWQE